MAVNKQAMLAFDSHEARYKRVVSSKEHEHMQNEKGDGRGYSQSSSHKIFVFYLALVDTGSLHSGRQLVAALCDALVGDAPQLVPVRRPHKPPDDDSSSNTQYRPIMESRYHCLSVG